MTDSEEIEERVAALIELLKKKDDKKIKECGEEIADAASDNEPWFEPDQVVQMLSTWLDACIAKRDDAVLDVTAKAIRWAKVEDGSEHPGMTQVLQKLAKALETPGSQHLETMFFVRAQPVKWTGDSKLYPALTDLLVHDKSAVLHDGLDLITSVSFMQLTELPDDEIAEIFKMVVEVAKHVQKVGASYKPGDAALSKKLAQKLTYLNRLFQAADVFCQMMVLNPTGFPKASAVIAVPTLVMGLKDMLSELKPKPKEQDLKEQLKQAIEACQSFIAHMPKPAAGASSDPAGDAKAYLKALKTANDADTVSGTMKMMMSSTSPKFLDVVLAKDSLQLLAATFKKVKKAEMDESYRTLQAFLSFVAEARASALEPVAEEMVQLFMAGPVTFGPKSLVEVLTEKSPKTAKMIWSKVEVWAKAVKDAKSGPLFEGNLYQVIAALESIPRVLEGAELEAFCKKVKELAELGKGSQMDGSLKCSALMSLKTVVVKDKARVPSDVLQWVRDLKEGDGSARDMAISLMDTFEGRSLEGAYAQIADMNSRFKEACGDMESLKKYVDDNVSELKDFISTIAKKLPMPVKFSSEPRYVVKKAILLHFECQAPIATRFCVLPEKATFTTETLEWSKWLKMGLSAAKLGKSILSADAIADAPGVVEQVKGLFSLYKKEDGEDFLSFISEPFLTSQEQDKLLNQLRAANFFENFRYDSQTAMWLCANCHAIYTRAGSNRSEQGLDEAASHPEMEILFPERRFEQGGGGLEGLQDKAENMKDAALEVKKTTTACCSLFGGMCEAEGGDEIRP